MADFKTWQAEATPDEVAVSVCFNRRLFREFNEASAALESAKVDGMLEQPADVEALARRVVELHERVKADEAKHRFVFRTVPYSDWEKLVGEHPPTEEQRARNRYLDWNPDSFPLVAVAASCADPHLTADDAVWLREQLPREEFNRLFDGAWQANVGGSSIPKSVSGTVARLGSALSSTTPASGESPSTSFAEGS